MRSLPLSLVLAASGCIWTPTNRTEHEKGSALTISGYVDGPGKSVKVRARNYSSGLNVLLTTVVSSNSEAFPNTGLYAWSATLTLSTASSNYWRPPSIGPLSQGTSSNGRLEVTAFLADNTQLVTFSDGAKDCVADQLADGETPGDAGAACYDGMELVLFDNTGVTNGADSDDVVILSEDDDGDISWSEISYESQGLEIVGYLCRPLAPGSGSGYPVHIYNHGGMGGLFEQYDLPRCQFFARHGWIVAMSAYRGEPIVPFAPPGTPPIPPEHVSEGQIEVCLGEVTDSMRLLDVVDHEFTDADMERVLMSGHSHGGCITTRAVQRGAPVYAAIDGFGPSDWTELHDECNIPGCDDLLDLLHLVTGGEPEVWPNAYNWRSPRYQDGLSDLFVGDLAARRDVRFMIQQGAIDTLVLPKHSCFLAEDAWGTVSQRYYVDLDGDADPNGVAAGCGQPWTMGDKPVNTWSGDRYLLVYQGVGHWISHWMEVDYRRFINSFEWGTELELPAPPDP